MVVSLTEMMRSVIRQAGDEEPMGICLTFKNYPGYPSNFAGRRTRVQLGENALYIIPAFVSSRFACDNRTNNFDPDLESSSNNSFS